MTCQGIVLAPTQLDGNLVVRDLNLQDWRVLSPRMIRGGAARGGTSEPHVLLVDDVDLDDVWGEIRPLFFPTDPEWDPGYLTVVHRLLRYKTGIKRRVVVEYSYDSEWGR